MPLYQISYQSACSQSKGNQSCSLWALWSWQNYCDQQSLRNRLLIERVHQQLNKRLDFFFFSNRIRSSIFTDWYTRNYIEYWQNDSCCLLEESSDLEISQLRIRVGEMRAPLWWIHQRAYFSSSSCQRLRRKSSLFSQSSRSVWESRFANPVDK